MLNTEARTAYGEDHEILRSEVRKFFAGALVPNLERWEEEGIVDRDFWTACGQAGLLCPTIPVAYGGAGADFCTNAVITEELAYAGSSAGITLHSDIVADYIVHYGTEAQKAHWLPRMISGETITAIAMTEPGAGSDLQGVRTTALADGDDYVVNGSKTYITNGQNADLVIVVAKTDPGGGARGISLILVEAGTPGFTKAPPLKKVGMKAQDTCELFFENMRVPRSNLLGAEEGQGFRMLMKELAWERLMIAILSVAAAQAALDWTVEYTRSRKVFGKPVADYQNSRFKLAEIKTEIAVAQVFVDRCLELVLKNELTPEAAAAAKLHASELVCRVLDECVQLHGGYGYMLEYPIARAYVDNRASRIYGGTNEIMKELIARTL